MIKKIAGYILGGIVVVMVLGYLTAMMLTELVPAILTRDWFICCTWYSTWEL